MRAAAPAASPAPSAAGAPPQGRDVEPDLRAAEIRAAEPRNMLVLSAHLVLMRIGWIFKTESVIIPAFVDTISGAGWLRGLLPVISRLGQSVPPVLLAHYLERRRRKRGVLVSTSVLKGLPFLALAVIWYGISKPAAWWMAPLFLLLYSVTFICNGLHQTVYGTIQGKLIAPTRRGRLLAMSTSLGAAASVLFALWLMGRWLALDGEGFTYIFAFTGAAFVVGALVLYLLVEPVDAPPPDRPGGTHGFRDALRVFREDENFRRLAVVILLFSAVLFLFPHYQALARERLGLAGRHLMLWVVTQNVTLGAVSLLAGPLADRRGNRLTLRLLIFATALTPLLSLGLVHIGPEWGDRLFWLVYIPLGCTPVATKVLVNYTLEISRPADHPRYLSTMLLAMSAPFFLSPLAGWMIDVTSFELVFAIGAVMIITGGLLTFRLVEPRHRLSGQSTADASLEQD